jgi:hypothetical protein
MHRPMRACAGLGRAGHGAQLSAWAAGFCEPGAFEGFALVGPELLPDGQPIDDLDHGAK